MCGRSSMIIGSQPQRSEEKAAQSGTAGMNVNIFRQFPWICSGRVNTNRYNPLTIIVVTDVVCPTLVIPGDPFTRILTFLKLFFWLSTSDLHDINQYQETFPRRKSKVRMLY